MILEVTRSSRIPSANIASSKATPIKFQVGIHKTKGILEYIHVDLWSPAKLQTNGDNRYFLSIIDDFSRRVWVYLLKSKDKKISKFKNWKVLMENQMSMRVKCLRTDNGLEFCNANFDNY